MMREIHIAGRVVDWVQRCSRCGDVLTDYRNTMVPDDQPPLTGWAVGAHIEVERGNPTAWWPTTDPATCEEQPEDSLDGLIL